MRNDVWMEASGCIEIHAEQMQSNLMENLFCEYLAHKNHASSPTRYAFSSLDFLFRFLDLNVKTKREIFSVNFGFN